MKEYKITIPIELIKISKTDFTKPVYLYWAANDLLSFSNKKKNKYCLGQISVDKEYTFILTQNTLGATLKYSDYRMYVSHGQLYITSCCYFAKERNSLFTIPKEILQICTIDFEKPVYLCFDRAENERYYLSNREDKSYSLGCIPFDEKHSFYLTDNICKTLGVSSAEKLSVYISDNKIYFHIFDNNPF